MTTVRDPILFGQGCDALEASGAQQSSLLLQVPEADRPVVGIWTVGETPNQAVGPPDYFLARCAGYGNALAWRGELNHAESAGS